MEDAHGVLDLDLDLDQFLKPQLQCGSESGSLDVAAVSYSMWLLSPRKAFGTPSLLQPNCTGSSVT